MPKSENERYGVMYVPFYQLQCAHLKHLLPLQLAPVNKETQFTNLNTLPHISKIPAALLDQDGTHIIELNKAAELAGIAPGASTSHAVARSTNIIFYARSPSHEQQLRDTILQLAYQSSSFIEDSGPGICTLNFKGTKDPRSKLLSLLEKIRSLGLQTQAGIGPNPEIALQAAKIADSLLEISKDCTVLKSLPLDSLNPSPYLLDIMRSWGIRTLGALTRLPRDEIGQRLGLEGLAIWDRAAGRSTNILKYVQPPETFEEAIDFEQPLETLEPLLFIVRRFVERLILRLESVYLLAAKVCLTFSLENDEKIIRTLQIPAPTRELDTLFCIISQYLETVQTNAPITSFKVSILPSKPNSHQFDLFQSGLKEPNRFFQTLGRLAALVGNDQVGIPYSVDTHRPDSVRMKMPELNWTRTRQNFKPRIGPGLRRYRPGISVQVENKHGKPHFMHNNLVTGTIVALKGPWKLSGNWWDNARWETEEWDVALENGDVYRVAQTFGHWLIVGVYD